MQSRHVRSRGCRKVHKVDNRTGNFGYNDMTSAGPTVRNAVLARGIWEIMIALSRASLSYSKSLIRTKIPLIIMPSNSANRLHAMNSDRNSPRSRFRANGPLVNRGISQRERATAFAFHSDV